MNERYAMLETIHNEAKRLRMEASRVFDSQNPPLGMVAALLSRTFESSAYKNPETKQETHTVLALIDFLKSLVHPKHRRRLNKMASDQYARNKRNIDDDPTQALRLRHNSRISGYDIQPPWEESDFFGDDDERQRSIKRSMRRHERRALRKVRPPKSTEQAPQGRR